MQLGFAELIKVFVGLRELSWVLADFGWPIGFSFCCKT